MIVYKFGGALARSKRGLEALVRLLREASKREATRARRSKKAGSARMTDHPHGIVLVTSAIGHTTRYLALAAELAEDGWLPEAEESLARTIAQHQQLASSLGLADETALFDRFESIAGDIAQLLEGVAILRELSPRTRDAILAAGEHLAIALIEALLRDREFPVRFADATDIIITDEQFGHAAPIMEEIAVRAEKLILSHLKRGHIVLVQGFAGATLDGITTTMGSESSDLTATLLAAALGAKEIVIWKTLPGLYTADPEFVKTPKLIRSMSFDEAEEMGRRGARILFPSFAHPLTMGESSSEAVLRIATPFSHTKGHTILEREATASKRSRRPLTIALEQHLLLFTLSPGSHTAAKMNGNTVQTRRREQRIQDALKQAVLTWASPEQISALIRKSDRRMIVRELSGSDFAHDRSFAEGETLAAISLIVRKNGQSDTALLAEVARSLRSFAVHAILPTSRSIIALVADAEAIPALRKLHHDLFEG